MRISDWSSDVCSSDLRAIAACAEPAGGADVVGGSAGGEVEAVAIDRLVGVDRIASEHDREQPSRLPVGGIALRHRAGDEEEAVAAGKFGKLAHHGLGSLKRPVNGAEGAGATGARQRSAAHTPELQSLMPT